MKKLCITSLIIGFFLSLNCAAASTDEAVLQLPVPTHADAAVILAKHSGLFDRYVSKDATLNDCVAFMNKHGVFFGLMEVVSGTEFTLKDCARVMGQIELVLTGEADFSAGKVLLPKGIDSWEEFCIMEDVNYRKGYDAIVQALAGAQQLTR